MEVSTRSGSIQRSLSSAISLCLHTRAGDRSSARVPPPSWCVSIPALQESAGSGRGRNPVISLPRVVEDRFSSPYSAHDATGDLLAFVRRPLLLVQRAID